MYWIEELYHKYGNEVKLVSQRGHEHWGFKTGQIYRIVKTPFERFPYGFEGVGSKKMACTPPENYGQNWKFESAGPLVVENE